MSAHHSNQDAAFYYRKSTDDQQQSIERQKDQIALYAASRGYRCVREFKDEGIAGDIFDRRTGFQQMLAAAAKKEFAVIVVDEPSRLSRQNPVELIETVIAPLRRAGIKIDTASKGPLDYDSLAGLIMMTVHAHKSEDESRDLSRRVLGGIVRKAKKGSWFGGVVPYGLRVVREIDPETGDILSRKYVLGPPEEVRVVGLIFDLAANYGWSLRRICRELEDRGVKPPVGNGRGKNKQIGRWKFTTVRAILLNRKYVGDFDWNKVHMGKYSALVGGRIEQSGAPNRRTSRNALSDVVIVPDVIPPIIDRDTFARAKTNLEQSRTRTSPCRDQNHYLFTHMLVCGDCGSFLHGQLNRGRKSYVCSKYKEYGPTACHRNTVEEKRLMRTILAVLQNDIFCPAHLEAIEKKLTVRIKEEKSSGETERLKARAESLAKDIAQGNINLARLPDDRLPGVVAQVRSWEDERAGIVSRLSELENGSERLAKQLAETKKQLWLFRDALFLDDEEAQTTVIRQVVSKIEVRFDHIITKGQHSSTGKGRRRNQAASIGVCLRPDLGLSYLFAFVSKNEQVGQCLEVALGPNE